LSFTRFSVRSSATGTARAVLVHVYDTKADLLTAARAFGSEVSEADTGAITHSFGYRFPPPESMRHMALIRLHLGQLDSETISHEVTHAAMHVYFADRARWHSRARAHMTGDNEVIAYLIGELTGRIHARLHQLGHITPAL
jgi:hypothetical protein